MPGVVDQLGVFAHAVRTWHPEKPRAFPRLKAKQITERLWFFGLIIGCGSAIICFLALLALLKRQYGSVSEAIATLRAKKWFSFSKGNVFKYRLLASHEEEDELDPETDVLWSGVTGRGEMSEADKRKMKEMAARMGKAMPDEEEEEQASNDGKQSFLTKADREALKKQKEKLRPVDEKDRELQKALVDLQMEESKKARTAPGMSCLQVLRLPVSLLLYGTYIIACLAIPYSFAETAQCKLGFRWEAHMIFFTVFIVVKLWELFLFAFDPDVPGQLSFADFVMKFACSFLGFLDGYSDATAIVVANACGSDLWFWMMLFYVFGVVLMQWIIMGAVCIVVDSSRACLFKMMHMDALAMCCTMRPEDGCALQAWRAVNVFRTVFEDIPMSVLQTMFVLRVKKNPVMIISILIGVGTSCLAVHSAIKRAATAAGTNTERLKAVAELQQAATRLGEDRTNWAASEAYLKASERVEQLLGDLLDEQKGDEARRLKEAIQKADEKVGVKSADTIANVMSGEPVEASIAQRLLPSAQDIDFTETYTFRRRTVAFAQQASKAREAWPKEAETRDRKIKGSAADRGEHHEGRYVKRDYESRRRTVEWAVRAQEEREQRIASMLVDAPGYCVGSKPPH